MRGWSEAEGCYFQDGRMPNRRRSTDGFCFRGEEVPAGKFVAVEITGSGMGSR